MELPTDSHEIVSDDDEIDYSVKPEFYDPILDEKDELWVRNKTKGCSSDAMLSCPACFTTLCLDCQRAMFVVNCKIKNDQILRQSERKPRKGTSSTGSERDVIFRPVCCSVCSTEVGVFDEDEVYHFFNVLPSES
ncbi:E2F-associated phosphoprotein isoform X2 [Tasmannia lanceolata]|uniref:E2F-associated phosphoprotein isoform X2 n=1 Tax=Tasmannia lanceolata TaxID=3420 RepID=UPI004063681E